MEQPKKRLKWPRQNSKDLGADYLKGRPIIREEKVEEKANLTETDGTESEMQPINKKVSYFNKTPIQKKKTNSDKKTTKSKKKQININNVLIAFAFVNRNECLAMHSSILRTMIVTIYIYRKYIILA